MILSAQLDSPRLAKDLEDCRKTCLNIVSVHSFESCCCCCAYSTAIARGISSVSSIILLNKELINLTTCYLCSLHSITGSTGLAVVILTLMLYTISLHIAAIAGASRVRNSCHPHPCMCI
jgi:hypothetical protein